MNDYFGTINRKILGCTGEEKVVTLEDNQV